MLLVVRSNDFVVPKMADSPASEISQDLESGDDATSAQQAAAKAAAAKDKECQYCHQHFTSSSLGRHLDQFLSKKKPDGIHDVDEIRRLRGGITRRIARSNRKDKSNDNDDGHSSQTSPAPGLGPGPQPGTLISSAVELNRIPPGGMHGRLNFSPEHSHLLRHQPPTCMAAAKECAPLQAVPKRGEDPQHDATEKALAKIATRCAQVSGRHFCHIFASLFFDPGRLC